MRPATKPPSKVLLFSTAIGQVRQLAKRAARAKKLKAEIK
jgi:hypothetical protein